MPKRERALLHPLLASALLVGACAGAQATRPTNPSASPPPSAVLANNEPTHSDSSCPAERVPVTEIRPLVDKYCVSCHSPGGAAGEDYDFRGDAALSARRRNIEAKLRLHVMPPPNAHQPSDAERMTLRCWAKG
jgi:uncharacterized membrane protein